ncbi:MAG TPA: GNAT family N-acetyltransferase [Gaiellaceae bacterium]|nr:GNAT family N-acetyltransferase [Gaiellaceae bacterium]
MLALETERLLLRPFAAEDADALAELVGDAEAMRFIGGTGDRATAAAWIERARTEYESGLGKLAVERRSDGRFLGRAGFWAWDTRVWAPVELPAPLGDGCELELGWALVRSAWGHGYATEAAAALRDHAFATRPRLISIVHPDNARSIAVAERLGAEPERRIETLRWGPAIVYAHRPAGAARIASGIVGSG